MYTHKGDESPYTESAAEFSHIEVYRPLVDDSYTLGNYSSIINAYKNIYGSSTSETDKYAMYELNVTYTKNYEIYITSTNKLDVRLYDENMQLVQVSDLNSNNNIVHIIKNLSIGTYYLKVAYEDTSKSGTINTKIVSRNTQYLLYNQENDILINYYG